MEFFKILNDIGLWDIISTVILVLAARKFVFPRKRIQNLNFQISRTRHEQDKFPLKINIEVRNFTGDPVVLSSMLVVLEDGIRSHPNSHGHSPTRELELEFHNTGDDAPDRRDCFLRDRESTRTWLALDPRHSDQEIDEALRKGKIGFIVITCTWNGDKLNREKIRSPIRI